MSENEVHARALRHVPLCEEPLSLAQLESHLASAADLLRGAIDQADFKAYIFPLMFFKRISDVYLEEYSQALAESGGDHEFAAFAENHRFRHPRRLPLGRTCARAPRISAKRLVDRVPRIEKANPETLYGIFGNAPWTNKDKLPDATTHRPDRALLRPSR